LVPLGRALQGCGAAAWHGMESAGSAVYHQVGKGGGDGGDPGARGTLVTGEMG